MKSIPFTKMSGSGNDFILMDNRDGVVPADNLPQFAERVCRRKLSAGADGLILVEHSENVDFRWRFFNSDGSLAEMCGNGARCVARFAHMNGIAKEVMGFETIAGIIHAQVHGDQVKIKMTDPYDWVVDASLSTASGRVNYISLNTGVPHVVIEVDDIESTDVVGMGREIRRHPEFAPAGTNVNFLEVKPAGIGRVRTYERGVEDETLACGTGIVASALTLALRKQERAPVTLETRSGNHLKVHFSKDAERFVDIYLEGDARIIYQGQMMPDAWLYDSASTIDP
ncbi:MAG: diaminopimelate epimerase [Desulfobacteraceae bacterium]